MEVGDGVTRERRADARDTRRSHQMTIMLLLLLLLLLLMMMILIPVILIE